MTRRDLGKLLSALAATSTGELFFRSWLSAAEPPHQHNTSAPPEVDRWLNYRPQFFSPDAFAALDTFSSVLIPTDETPGAKEAHVPQFIDFVVANAAEYAPELQTQWRQFTQHLLENRFAALSPDEQIAFVRNLSRGETEAHFRDSTFELYRQAKRLIVFGYYTSRVGMIDNLEYKGLAYLSAFPACEHPEHLKV